MPDPNKQTVSATEISAVLGVSPYASRWALYQRFAHGVDIEVEPDARMRMGQLLQPVIFQLTQEHYSLDVQDNKEDYLRHPDFPVGATIDGFMRCPTRGGGIVEAKNVDWLRYRDTWAFDADGAPVRAPWHIELQVQHQMLVTQSDWGVIAALVGGNEMVFLERNPDYDTWAVLIEEAVAFLEAVKNLEEPPVQGTPADLEVLYRRYPEVHVEPVWNMSEEGLWEEALALEEACRDMQRQADVRRVADKAHKAAKARALAITGDRGLIRTPNSWVRVTKGKAGTRVNMKEESIE